MRRGAIIAGLTFLAWTPVIAANDLVHILTNASLYAPPQCHSSPCVLTGPGGIVSLWTKHVDRNLALGRSFVVEGVCASACEIAARRAHAKLRPGAILVPHAVTKW